MYHEENLGKYFNNLRRILRSKLELLDYYEQVVRYQELEKKAFLRLVFQRPVYCILRSIVYLPINILRYLDRIADRFYLSKIKNEVDVLRNEIYSKKKMDKITEIRIEEVKDYENKEFYYYIYCVKDTGERIEIGKSKTRPQCYKQLAVYH